MDNTENLGYIRAEKIEVGDFIMPGPMALNKRTWKVVGIEPVGDRLFIKVEILDDSYPNTNCPIAKQEKPGDIIRIDTTRDNKLPIRRPN